MANRYRLSSKVYDRETPAERIAPKKVYFISVEGVSTEVEYLQGISDYRDELGIDTLVNVEVLRRRTKDGHSAPEQVIELLEEYIDLREIGADIYLDLPEELTNNFSNEFIRLYLNSPSSVDSKERSEFEQSMTKIGYDMSYRKYLANYSNDTDEFCILIDRDSGSHSTEAMFSVIQYCEEKGYRCYISNPCFEFWLLLHFSDVIKEYSDKLDLIKENNKLSNNHTYVSKELSSKAHHGKSGLAFQENYLPNVEVAIKRASQFASDNNSLISELGCNIWKLIKEMQSFSNHPNTD